MNSSKILPLAQLAVRQFSRSTARAAGNVQEVPSSKFAQLKEAQKKFGLEDGTPVYIKAGLFDRVLYLTTVGLIVVGTYLSGEVIYKLATK